MNIANQSKPTTDLVPSFVWVGRRLRRSPDRYQLLALLLIAAIGFSLWQWLDGRAQNEVNCSAAFQIDQQLPNGGRWELCWEHRSREGIVLHDIFYTTPTGDRRKVLTEAAISQVHVPYDDNSGRFHDITDDGFGSRNLADLVAAECPGGTLIPFEDKNVLCQQIASRGQAWHTSSGNQQGYALNLFSISTSGEYNYIPLWRFADDGSIYPIMGASGRLQKFDEGSSHSWPIRANGIGGVSHIHNYYWRLDFDLGESGNDDVVEELDLMPADAGSGRNLSVTPLEIETSRSVEPQLMRSWRIRDGIEQSNPAINNLKTSNNAQFIAYQLDPINLNHRDVGPPYEPWTHNDLYVTTYNECELYVSHNPGFLGCGSQITEFVNGEALIGADLVLWYGVTFHHIPRDEDEPNMHTHWDGFQISPMNWTATNELLPQPTPITQPIAEPTAAALPLASFTVFPITGTAPLTVTLDGSTSTDTDGEIVGYDWAIEDKSPANGITTTQLFTTTGRYSITLTVTDDGGFTADSSQTITVLDGTVAECLLGDVNCDSSTNIVDALFILQHVQGTRAAIDNEIPPPNDALYGPACDVLKDGNCNLDDAITIFECSTAVANQLCPTPGQVTATAEEIRLFEELLKQMNAIYLPIIR